MQEDNKQQLSSQKVEEQSDEDFDTSEEYENEESSQSNEEVPQQKKIYIMGEDANNQMLIVPLFPNFAIWTRGQVVFANKDIVVRNERDMVPYFEQIKTFLRLNRIPPKRIENNSRQLAYYCVRRKNGGGKIIFLDHSVYQGDFYINYDKLLTINYETSKYELKRCNQLGYLSKIKRVEEDKNDLLITLQSNKGNIIIEKTLEEGEKLYLQNSEVIAMSTKIKVTRQKGVVVLQGKGFVFIQNKTNDMKDKNTLNFIIFLLLLLITLTTL